MQVGEMPTSPSGVDKVGMQVGEMPSSQSGVQVVGKQILVPSLEVVGMLQRVR